MRFYSPWAFALLSFIPLVIFMYLLKQKFQEREISSTFLWEQVLKDIEVNTPWQKLKKNLLLFMQISIIIFFTLAAANPHLLMKGKASENIIIVVDNSGSMNAIQDGKSGLERAKSEAVKLVKALKPNSNISIISSGAASKIELGNTVDKNAAIKKIDVIKETNAAGDINDSAVLVKSVSKQYESYKAYFYTDSNLDLKDINGEVIGIASIGENVSLDYISHTLNGQGMKVLVRVTNRSKNNLSREILLYNDDELLDMKEIELKPLETAAIYFNEPMDIFKNGIPETIKAEIGEKDALMDDNVVYDVVKQKQVQKVLMVTDSNIFMEKAINIINNVELYKTNSIDKIGEDYDLYIFDGDIPKELPKSGDILLINPGSSSVSKVNGILKGGFGTVLKSEITNYMENAFFTVSELKDIEMPSWGKSIIKVGESNAAFIGEYKGRKIGVIGFDLHKSDFVLIPEFPVFINNLINYLIGTDFLDKTKYYCGEEADFKFSPDTIKAYVETPSKKERDLKITYPAVPFKETYETGIYTLHQKIKDKDVVGDFAVNFPASSESQIGKNIQGNSNIQSTKSIDRVIGVNLRLLIIMIILFLVIAEWLVYIRSYN